jgi:hypothetical protein
VSKMFLEKNGAVFEIRINAALDNGGLYKNE